MRRDIITIQDVVALKEYAAADAGETARSPGRRKLGPVVVDKTAVPLIPEPDSWDQRLLKYIPGEAVGLYLALDRAVHTVHALEGEALAFWLAIVLAISALFNVLYLRVIWRVKRNTQIAASTLALLAYVYATGGFFEPAGLACASVQMIVVILVTAFLIFFKPPGQAVDAASRGP
jgi:hypothetical protein